MALPSLPALRFRAGRANELGPPRRRAGHPVAARRTLPWPTRAVRRCHRQRPARTPARSGVRTQRCPAVVRAMSSVAIVPRLVRQSACRPATTRRHCWPCREREAMSAPPPWAGRPEGVGRRPSGHRRLSLPRLFFPRDTTQLSLTSVLARQLRSTDFDLIRTSPGQQSANGRLLRTTSNQHLRHLAQPAAGVTAARSGELSR